MTGSRARVMCFGHLNHRKLEKHDVWCCTFRSEALPPASARDQGLLAADRIDLSARFDWGSSASAHTDPAQSRSRQCNRLGATAAFSGHLVTELHGSFGTVVAFNGGLPSSVAR